MTTPITKRIGLICITLICFAVASLVGLGKINFDQAQGVFMPCLAGILALIDGGK